MRFRSGAMRLLLAGITVLSATTLASAGDKKPAAIAASTTGTTANAAAASAKPAAVQASTSKVPTFATHLKIVDAAVPLKEKMTIDGKVYKIATKLHEVDLTVEGHGVETKFGKTIKVKGQKDKEPEYEGLTAFQILVEQKYFEYKEGIGFVPTKKFAKFGDISVSSGDGGGGGGGGAGKTDNTDDQGKNRKNEVLKSGDDIDLKTEEEKEAEKKRMVDPDKTEGVAKEPSQFGSPGLFGKDWTVDENCMAGRSKMYSECVDRCKERDHSPEEFGECTEKCGKNSLSAYGDCEGAAPRWEETP